MKRRGVIPEFSMATSKARRAGFVPSFDSDTPTELWQIWCRNASDPDEARRATFQDLKKAGFKMKKKKKTKKGKGC